MINLNDLTYEDLQQNLIAVGEAKFKASQIFKWFSRGVTNFDEMSDISKATKEKLINNFSLSTCEIDEKFVSSIDGTVKYLMKLKDGNVIESVAMKYKHGITVCISTQVGCFMGCKFCASTLGGKVRDLTAGEILGQVATVQKDIGERISNIVLMGIGEPLDNFDNVMVFLKNVNNPLGLNIGNRHISLSTCGITDKIYELATENIQITLSISLHAPNDEIRSAIMPINNKYKVNALMKACKFYISKTKRRISFEYILIDGVNDSLEAADSLAKLVHGILCHVNLIPANFVPESGLLKSTNKQVNAFKDRLEKHHINVTIRRELGSDISASCGQLRQKNRQIQ